MIDEAESVDEIFFLTKGHFIVGYNINDVKKYCMQFKDRGIIGAYEVTYSKKSEFIYTAFSYIEGFFIRVRNWVEIISENPDVTR